MKTEHYPTFITRLLCLCLALPAMAGLADEALSIDWYTVDGGGGTTSAGEFTLSGTIGQPDAGTLTFPTADFNLFGGYWGQFGEVAPVGPDDRPAMNINLTDANTLVLAWPAAYVGYSVQSRHADAQDWTDVTTPPPKLVGGEYQVTLTLSPTDAPTFFRLRRP